MTSHNIFNAIKLKTRKTVDFENIDNYEQFTLKKKTIDTLLKPDSIQKFGIRETDFYVNNRKILFEKIQSYVIDKENKKIRKNQPTNELYYLNSKDSKIIFKIEKKKRPAIKVSHLRDESSDKDEHPRTRKGEKNLHNPKIFNPSSQNIIDYFKEKNYSRNSFKEIQKINRQFINYDKRCKLKLERNNLNLNKIENKQKISNYLLK